MKEDTKVHAGHRPVIFMATKHIKASLISINFHHNKTFIWLLNIEKAAACVPGRHNKPQHAITDVMKR